MNIWKGTDRYGESILKSFTETGRSYLQEGKRSDWIPSFSICLHLHTISMLSRFRWRDSVSIVAVLKVEVGQVASKSSEVSGADGE